MENLVLLNITKKTLIEKLKAWVCTQSLYSEVDTFVLVIILCIFCNNKLIFVRFVYILNYILVQWKLEHMLVSNKNSAMTSALYIKKNNSCLVKHMFQFRFNTLNSLIMLNLPSLLMITKMQAFVHNNGHIYE